MNTIPLVKGNTQEEINTSLIALKKALDEMNSSSSKTDAFVQSQIKQINELIENINTQIEDLQPVDTVTIGNMHSVTSNAVARVLAQQGFSNIKDYWNVTTTPFNFAHKLIKVPPHTIILGNFWANLGDLTNTIFSLLVATFYENISEDNADISAVSMVKSDNYEFINNSFSYVNDTNSEQKIYVSVRSYIGFSTRFKYNLNFIKIK